MTKTFKYIPVNMQPASQLTVPSQAQFGQPDLNLLQQISSLRIKIMVFMCFCPSFSLVAAASVGPQSVDTTANPPV